MTVSIRTLRRSDLKQAAALHRIAFPSFFLSELGEPFLREFYRAFLDQGAVGLVALSDSGELLGVVVGHTQPSGFFRRLVLRRWYAFAFASIGLVIRRPRIAGRLLRALTYRGRTPFELRGALLSSICVAPLAQGENIGKQLIQAWTSNISAVGCPAAYLTTDAIGNDSTNGFYVRAGWRLEGTYKTPEGREMNCYAWQDGRA